jgi:hypothetical protein
MPSGLTLARAFADGLWLAITASPLSMAVAALLAVLMTVRVVQAVAHPVGRRDPIRRFSQYDKATILARAGGRCEHHGLIFGRCRQTERLEADHVHPHSRGGQTAVANGQALCRRHNRAKRATVPFRWQLRALERRREQYFPPAVPRSVTRYAPRKPRAKKRPSAIPPGTFHAG